MRHASRFVLLLTASSVIALGGYLVALAWLRGGSRVLSIGGLNASLGVSGGSLARGALTAAVAAVSGLIVAAIVTELLPRRDARLRLRGPDGRWLPVPRATVEARLAEDARSVAHVLGATACARARHGRVSATVTVQVDRYAALPRLIDEIRTAMREGLRTHVGVELTSLPDIVALYEDLGVEQRHTRVSEQVAMALAGEAPEPSPLVAARDR